MTCNYIGETLALCNHGQPPMAEYAKGVPRTKGGLRIIHADGSETHVDAKTASRQARELVAKNQPRGRVGARH